MKKCILAILLFSAFLTKPKAQSYHFSQFYSTPLLVNPANTGFTNGPYRLASNFKTQGMIGDGPYFTGYLSADVSLLRDKLTEGNTFGLGMYIMNDQSLNGALQTNSAGLSVGYNVVLDEDGHYSLGVGMQGTFHQRTLDYNRLSFENQFSAQGFQGGDRGEPLDYRKKKYMDVNAGIMYHANLEDQSFFAGVAAYNTAGHRENMLPDEFKMPLRFTLQAGGRLDVTPTGSVYFSLINMRQAKAVETTAGIAYGVLLREEANTEVDFGMWYRYKDALIPYVGFQTNGFQVGFTYDQTVSARKPGSQIRNGYELTLLFNAPDNRELKRLIPWY